MSISNTEISRLFEPIKKSNMQWITREDHRFKTNIDIHEYRKMRRRSRAG